MKRSIVLSLILAICCLLPFTASAEEWSDFFALNEETAIGYDEALASYQDTPNAPAGTRIELLPSAAILSGTTEGKLEKFFGLLEKKDQKAVEMWDVYTG